MSNPDQYSSVPSTRSSPAKSAFSITASNDALEIYAKALRVFVPSSVSDAEVVIEDSLGTVLTFNYPSGSLTIEPMAVAKVTSITTNVVVHGYRD